MRRNRAPKAWLVQLERSRGTCAFSSKNVSGHFHLTTHTRTGRLNKETRAIFKGRKIFSASDKSQKHLIGLGRGSTSSWHLCNFWKFVEFFFWKINTSDNNGAVCSLLARCRLSRRENWDFVCFFQKKKNQVMTSALQLVNEQCGKIEEKGDEKKCK